MDEERRGTPWTRRLRFDTPRRRAGHLALAVLLAISGLGLAIVHAAAPTTHTSTLATSGSFFALAESGDTLYAASENGGSVLLERSMDRGVDWSATPVPYSIVAGGSPWIHATVAVDGERVVLAASSGGTPIYLGPPPGGFAAALEPFGPCGTNSTVLLASSADGGHSWSTSTLVAANLSISSLDAGIVGGGAAVAWLGDTTACSGATTQVQAVTSGDGGADWSLVQSLSVAGTLVPGGENPELAPGRSGLTLGFGLNSLKDGSSELALFSYDASSGRGFVPATVLPAPSSWTLQGSADGLAYLLTPTYLVPLTTPPYTALPFNQLQSDGPSIGALPRVVSLTPLEGGVVEVAATTPDALGVDCWQFDTGSAVATPTCHVRLEPALSPAPAALPIVALIDGGGWWTAIGASGPPSCGLPCPIATPYGGAVPPYANGSNSPAPIAAPAAVGTSICLTGCSSAQGLLSYSYSPSDAGVQSTLLALAVGLMLLGLGWIAAVVGIPRLARRSRTARADPPVPTEAAGTLGTIRLRYRLGLVVWAIAWSPLAVIALLGPPGGDPSAVVPVALVAGVIGALAAIPWHWSARRRLAYLLGSPDPPMFSVLPPPEEGEGEPSARRADRPWLDSWAVAAVLGLVLLLGLPIGGSGGIASGGSASPEGAIYGSIVLALLAAFVVLRALYHARFSRNLREVGVDPGSPDPSEAPVRRRIAWGAALLPLNPWVGLVAAYALGMMLPVAAGIGVWIALPLTYLGIALLLGGFGPTFGPAGLPRSAGPTGDIDGARIVGSG